MTNLEFTAKAKEIAERFQTVYLWGTFGAPLSESLITQKAKQYPRNYSENRKRHLRTLISNRPWAFDCVGLIKGILWGWSGKNEKTYGGAKYAANGVPDVGANAMAKACTDSGTDWDHLLPGEAVFRSGHIGIYVGDGSVVEATLRGTYDGVVITPLSEGNWEGHGKLPWIDYEAPAAPEKPSQPPAVGDTVFFSGSVHYPSANASSGYRATPGPATVTRYLKGRKHPYHLIHKDKTSNVYGWVDGDTVQKA